VDEKDNFLDFDRPGTVAHCRERRERLMGERMEVKRGVGGGGVKQIIPSD